MEKHKISASLEDYMEAIYQISEVKQVVKAIDLSKRLDVKRSSVAEAIKNLTKRELVTYENNELKLTDKGLEIAKEVINRHKTLYDFFAKILNIEPEEAQLNACRVEHVITENAFKNLTIFVKDNIDE